MKRSEIIKKFLKEKFQPTSKIINYFLENPNQLNDFLIFLKNRKISKPILTNNLLKEFLETSKIKFKIDKRFEEVKEVKIKEVLEFFKYKFNFISNLLKKKIELLNLISINKISPRSRKFSIIGIIREIDEPSNKILIEDLTGSLEVFIEKSNLKFLVEDEVLGFYCVRKEGRVVVERIVFPDIPLKRSVEKLEDEGFLVVGSNLSCFLEKLKLPNKKIIISFEEPSNSKIDIFFSENCGTFNNCFSKIFQISIQNLKILGISSKILLPYKQRFNESYMKTVQILLRKRDLNPKFSVENISKLFLLEEIPDIILIFDEEEAEFLNYKGISIISVPKNINENIYWIINLHTREIIKGLIE